jgi:hypothetical protein
MSGSHENRHRRVDQRTARALGRGAPVSANGAEMTMPVTIINVRNAQRSLGPRRRDSQILFRPPAVDRQHRRETAGAGRSGAAGMGKARERWRKSLDRALPETPWLYGHLANGRVVPNRAAAANITPLGPPAQPPAAPVCGAGGRGTRALHARNGPHLPRGHRRRLRSLHRDRPHAAMRRAPR